MIEVWWVSCIWIPPQYTNVNQSPQLPPFQTGNLFAFSRSLCWQVGKGEIAGRKGKGYKTITTYVCRHIWSTFWETEGSMDVSVLLLNGTSKFPPPHIHASSYFSFPLSQVWGFFVVFFFPSFFFLHGIEICFAWHNQKNQKWKHDVPYIESVKYFEFFQ